MITDEQEAALTFLGLSGVETRFLALVALHGGYCLRRQFSAFIGVACPNPGQRLLEALVRSRRFVRLPYPNGNGYVYHLVASRVYEVVEADGFSPAWASSATIARHLMVLDLVIAHRRWLWLAREVDKVAFFKSRFNVDLAELTSLDDRLEGLPQAERAQTKATRALVGCPIVFGGEPGAERVHLVTLVLGSPAGRFSRFLIQHSWLLARLPAWTVMAVAPAHRLGLAACHAVFERIVRPGNRTAKAGVGRRQLPGAGADAADADVQRYFRSRHAIEAGASATLSSADLDHYREARNRHIGPTMDRLYASWRVQTAVATFEDRRTAYRSKAFAGAALDPSRGELMTYELQFGYHGFGTLAGDV